MHISISWKSYWFENVEAQRAFEQARGTLTIAEIERRLLGDLRGRGLLRTDESPELPDIVDLLIDTYQRFTDLQSVRTTSQTL